jgi:hypothetical protein
VSRSDISKLGGTHSSMPKGTREVFAWLNKQPCVKRFSIGATIGTKPRVPWRLKPQRIINGAVLVHVRGDDVLMMARVYSDQPDVLWAAIVAEWAA